MRTPEPTSLLPASEVELPVSGADNPRVQTLQDTWLLTLFAALLATAVPWFVSGFNIDFGSASWALLALGASYAALSAVANLQRSSSALRSRLLAALHALGVVAMGFLWQRCGGLQNPAFLVAFVLPVIGAHTLSRWQPYATAILAILVVGTVAVSSAPELQWLVGGLPVIGHWLSALFGAHAQSLESGSVFAGFYAPVGYDLVLLQVFAILLLACATTAEALGDSLQRIGEHLHTARGEAARSQDMWSTLLRQLPMPALLVDADSQEIVLTSRQLSPLWPQGSDLVGQRLVQAVRCSYPERLQELLNGEGGVVSPVVLHTADALRIVTIRVQATAYEGRRLALLLIEDSTATFRFNAALEAEEHAILVITANGSIVTANKSARALFPEASPGSDAGHVLSRSNGAQRWWEPGLTGLRRVHVTISRRTYLTTCTAVPLPGEEEAMFVVAFTPLLTATSAADAMSVAR